MKTTPPRNAAWLLKTAKELALQLQSQTKGTALVIRPSSRIRTSRTDTRGWAAEIGTLGKGRPTLEVWLDKFTGHEQRKLYVCFYSRDSKQVRALSRASKRLWPVRRITDADVNDDDAFVLKRLLPRGEFNEPIEECYDIDGYYFFGFYDPTSHRSGGAGAQFMEHAVGFVVDVVRSQPEAKEADSQSEVYPRCENRKLVKAHLGRERSGYLAAACKRRDDYQCQVCGLKFTTQYGPLGDGFAEAHHKKPLGRSSDKVKTKLEDLITVCANCHRMLHRMDGKPGDIKSLQDIVTQQTKRRK